MVYIHKILPMIVSPIGVSILLIILGLIFHKRKLIICSFLIIWLASMPYVSNALWRELELADPPKSISTLGKVDAVVVLSTGMRAYRANGEIVINWPKPDRFFAGLSAIKNGNSENIIFTRGKLPWSNSIPEGDILSLKAQEFGIPKENIFLTEIVANTSDEAKSVKSLIEEHGFSEVLLITSSFHMPRASLLFDRERISFKTFPVDHKAHDVDISWDIFFPSARGLHRTSEAIREYIGRFYYKILNALNV